MSSVYVPGQISLRLYEAKNNLRRKSGNSTGVDSVLDEAVWWKSNVGYEWHLEERQPARLSDTFPCFESLGKADYSDGLFKYMRRLRDYFFGIVYCPLSGTDRQSNLSMWSRWTFIGHIQISFFRAADITILAFPVEHQPSIGRLQKNSRPRDLIFLVDLSDSQKSPNGTFTPPPLSFSQGKSQVHEQ